MSRKRLHNLVDWKTIIGMQIVESFFLERLHNWGTQVGEGCLYWVNDWPEKLKLGKKQSSVLRMLYQLQGKKIDCGTVEDDHIVTSTNKNIRGSSMRATARANCKWPETVQPYTAHERPRPRRRSFWVRSNRLLQNENKAIVRDSVSAHHREREYLTRFDSFILACTLQSNRASAKCRPVVRLSVCLRVWLYVYMRLCGPAATKHREEEEEDTMNEQVKNSAANRMQKSHGRFGARLHFTVCGSTLKQARKQSGQTTTVPLSLSFFIFLKCIDCN